jgi:hypothetical protein
VDEKINLMRWAMQIRRWYIFLLVAGLLFTNYWLLVANSYAQQESVTITTYYPSPYGSYNELSTNKLAVGYTDPNEQPNIVGDIRLKPWTTVPSTESGKAGEVAYGSDGYLYVHNGSGTWVKQTGGGGGCIMTFCGCQMTTCTCVPPSCPSGFNDIGTNGEWLVSLDGYTVRNNARWCCRQ